MSRLKNIQFSIIAIIIFFALAELISRLFVFPGAHSFIERRIMEQTLTQKKDKDEFRVLLLGESTMQGLYLYPYSTIDKWLKLYLNDLLPENVSSRVTVTNFGRIGASSEFITKSFIDTIRYKPDLAVFYIANNDFCLYGNRREFFAHKSLKDMIEEFGVELPKHSAFLNAFNRLVIRSKMKRNKIREAQSSKLNNWYPEDDSGPVIRDDDILYMNSDKYNMIKTNFENSIKKIIDAAQRHSIPIIFLESVARWKEYEPVRSIHDTTIGKDTLAEWTRISFEADRALANKAYAEALNLYNSCLTLDPLYAITYYRIGECYEGLNDPKKANEYYSTANDYDRYPIRAPSSVNLFYETFRGAEAKKIFIIPTQKLFESQSPDGIVRENLIGDQIHPSIDGQALIALAIARLICEKDLLAPKAQWRWGQLRPVAEMKKDLKLDKNGELETHLALATYVKRDYIKAAELLEKAYVLKKDSVFINSWLAWTYWKMGELDKAAAIYRELYRERPSLAAPFFKKHPDIEKLLVAGH